MSAIQKELLKATDLKADDFKTRGDLHLALVKAVNELSDDAWGALTVKAQDWFNGAADAKKAKKDLPEFPDYEEPKEETRSRRRGSDDDGEKGKGGGEETAVEKLEEGQQVKITYKKRGGEKVAEGKVVEISKRKGFLVVKEEDGETEIDFDAVVSTEVFHGTAAAQEPEPDAGPAEGDEVKFTTKRGKEVQGVIKELGKDFLVLENGDDYDLDRIDGDITIVKKAKASGKEETRSRRGSDDDEKGKGKDDDEKKRSSNPKGVSVGRRIRELLAGDPDMAEEAVGKRLEKEEIEFRPPTLKMIYRDCTEFIKLLRDEGQMKKAK